MQTEDGCNKKEEPVANKVRVDSPSNSLGKKTNKGALVALITSRNTKDAPKLVKEKKKDLLQRPKCKRFQNRPPNYNTNNTKSKPVSDLKQIKFYTALPIIPGGSKGAAPVVKLAPEPFETSINADY